ncbi:uncharacterized protein ATC70_007163 [Mucor velutinosus]|uniref:Lupus La protein n=1 Tax=Mucor velutinosus TaxID=708070 RepID=A0AAN7D430_9FUNG|nr:hypothetical protein ATC70_007163 [Mucor velutinosus]
MDTNKDETVKVEAVDTTPVVQDEAMPEAAAASSTGEYPPSVHKVHRQLLAIFDPENIKKDNFFRELVERDPEHWVPIKKLSMIKRFKEILEGDLTLFEQAVALAPQDFEMNDEKTQLRSIMEEKKEEVKQDLHADSADKKNARNQQIILNHFEVQNKRSIYSKGFTVDPEPTEAELKEFYSKYGRILSLRHRREGNGNKRHEGAFKGSIFVEFETPEIAQKVVEEAIEYNGQELLNMIKADYVEMKRVEKYSDAEFNVSRITHRHLVEYSNAEEYGFKEIKELVKSVANVGRLEPLENKKGCGVLELFKTTPEEFLAKLPDQKLENINFCLVSAAARSYFNKIQKEAAKNGRGNGRNGGRGGRGGGRGGRGGARGGGARDGNKDGRKRGNDNPNNQEINNKRARTIVEVKSSAITAPTN